MRGNRVRWEIACAGQPVTHARRAGLRASRLVLRAQRITGAGNDLAVADSLLTGLTHRAVVSQVDARRAYPSCTSRYSTEFQGTQPCLSHSTRISPMRAA